MLKVHYMDKLLNVNIRFRLLNYVTTKVKESTNVKYFKTL